MADAPKVGRAHYAVVEWLFLTTDSRFKDLDLDLRLAYLMLWCYCVEVRRDWFSLKLNVLRVVGELTRIDLGVMERMRAECIANELLARGPGGVLVVPGVRLRHNKLRGWCAALGGGRADTK